jgi:hypothetical protein
VKEPLDSGAAGRLIRHILAVGVVRFSSHTLDEMRKDGLTTPDVLNILRSGVVEAPELERGTWRYRMRGRAAYVVVAFRSELSLIVVTTWRLER